MTVEDMYYLLEKMIEDGDGDLRIGASGSYGKFHEFKDQIKKTVDPETELTYESGETVVVVF